MRKTRFYFWVLLAGLSVGIPAVFDWSIAGRLIPGALVIIGYSWDYEKENN